MTEHGYSADVVLETRFLARPDELKEMRVKVVNAVMAAGMDAPRAADVALALSEACANIIEHGYQGCEDQWIGLTVKHEVGRLVFLLQDDAPCVEPACVVSRELSDLRPGGLGVHFMQQIMDEVRFHPRPGGGNILKMIKDI